MKFLALFLICLASLYSIHKIKVIGLDQSAEEYSSQDINHINFEFDQSAKALLTFLDDDELTIAINSESKIYFDSLNIIFSNNNFADSLPLNSIKSIHFELINNAERYPFGELVVDQIILDDLDNPWSIDFLDENRIIFTEKSLGLFIYDIQKSETIMLKAVPPFADHGQGGMLDVTLDPNFADNKLIYLAYATQVEDLFTTAICRARLDGDELSNLDVIFQALDPSPSAQHFGSRIIFDNNRRLYFSIGDRGIMNNAQDSSNHYGAVLRINPDGSIPDNNPYLHLPNAKPELFTMGNRNIQGMFYLPENDQIWAVEHGPRGGDELNLIEAGSNYAWPLATYGINYDGSPITDLTSIPGYKDPIKYWVPSIAPCGMDLISFDPLNNQLDLIITALAGRHLNRLLIKNYQVVDSVRSLQGYARFRDVQLSPDGFLYAATQAPGRIIRLKKK